MGHRAQYVTAVGLAAQALALMARRGAGDLSFVPLLASVALIAWAGVALRTHQRGLCASCMADVPADGPVRAQRAYRRLWFYHVAHEPPLLRARLLLIVWTTMCAFRWVPLWVGVPVVLASLGLSVPALLSVPAHRKVEPWCPYCGWDEDDDDGGGDGGTGVPDPDPAIPHAPPR